MSTHPQDTRRRAPAALRWLGQGLSFIVLCAASLAALVLIIIPLLTGSQTYSVLTSSMAPAYPPGTFLVVKPTDFDQLQTGDVITYQIESGRPDVITHRIIGFTANQNGERLAVTQGDNNDVADPEPVMDLQVRGELFYAVPYVGFLANALGQTDRSWIITALAVALIGYGVFTIVSSIVRGRRAKTDQDDAESPAAPETVSDSTPQDLSPSSDEPTTAREPADQGPNVPKDAS